MFLREDPLLRKFSPLEQNFSLLYFFFFWYTLLYLISSLVNSVSLVWVTMKKTCYSQNQMMTDCSKMMIFFFFVLFCIFLVWGLTLRLPLEIFFSLPWLLFWISEREDLLWLREGKVFPLPQKIQIVSLQLPKREWNAKEE